MQCAPSYGVDLCVITALASPELDAVRSLPWKWGEAKAFDDVGYQYEGSFGTNRRAIAIAAPRMGMVASATLATKLIMQARPKILAMTGICAGFRSESALGDVLVADPCWDWQMGKYKSDTFEIGPDQIGTALEISQKMQVIGGDKEVLAKIWSDSDAEKPTNVPMIRTGPVATGSAVLADQSVADTIVSQHRKTLGVDMELYGVFSAARDCSRPKPLVVGIKSVCDFADQYKNDKYQKYCAHVSARCLEILVTRYESELFS
jgi:nucleoside phosphorylase